MASAIAVSATTTRAECAESRLAPPWQASRGLKRLPPSLIHTPTRRTSDRARKIVVESTTRKTGTTHTHVRSGTCLDPTTRGRHVAARAAADAAFGGSVSVTVPESGSSWDQEGSKWGPVAGIPQDNPLSHRDAADPDSKFFLFRGVELHYKEIGPQLDARANSNPATSADPSPAPPSDESRLATGAVLLHGFGASSFSWKKLMRPLAECLCGPVVAYDRPGFGFTQRVPPPPVSTFLQTPASNPYSLAFSAEAAVAFGRRVEAETGASPIAIGHSAGCLVAADSAIRNPKLFSALVLIAPAIVPPFLGKKQQPAPDTLATSAASDSSAATGPLLTAVGASTTSSGDQAEEPVGEEVPNGSTNGSVAAGMGSAYDNQSESRSSNSTSNKTQNQSLPSPQRWSPVRALLTAALFIRLSILQLATQIAKSARQTAALTEAVPVKVAEALPQPDAKSGFPAKIWDALGALALMLVSGLAFFGVQIVLLVNKLADGVANLAEVLGFGWKGVSVAMSAAILRNYVAMAFLRRTFNVVGVKTVVSAWFDKTLCSKDDIAGYTKPLKCKNWDRALMEYVVASGSNPPVGEKLGRIKCPVLVMTGENDTIVPAWNSKRVADAIPGSKLVTIKNCGHVPQEEKPSEVLNAITKFLQETQISNKRADAIPN